MVSRLSRVRRLRLDLLSPAALLVACLSGFACADPLNIPGESAEGVFGESSVGKAEPDNKTGAMVYSYPFELPAARGKPQPRLALTYSSNTRDREAGYGWGLDMPVIERKPLSGNPCFEADGAPKVCGDGRSFPPDALTTAKRPTFTPTLELLCQLPIACASRQVAARQAPVGEEGYAYRFTYSGQPLVYICRLPGAQQIGEPGCGDQPHPAWAVDGWRYFRLQVDGQSSRFYLSPNRRYWRVQLKGGQLLEFGEPPNSPTRGVERAFGNKNAILRWRLVSSSDALHKLFDEPVNRVEYRWKELGKRGLLFLTDILDTPRADNAGGDLGFAHHAQLTWGPPDFPQTFYADPYRATPDLRLVRVAVASAAWEPAGPREVLRTYILDYAPAQGAGSTTALNQTFGLWHHSFLNQIRMEGRCGQLEDERGNIPVNRECPQIARLPATSFEYEDGHPAFGAAAVSAVRGGPPDAVDQNRVLPFLDSVGIVDFNRDGLPDLVQGWGPGLNCGETTLPNPDPDVQQCQFGRPMVGYLNRGVTPGQVKLNYQCFDAGRIDDTTGLTHYSTQNYSVKNRGFLFITGFFSGLNSVTLPGSWGEGVVAWSNAQYAPFRAKPLAPVLFPTVLPPGSGCDVSDLEHFKKDDFDPDWKWETTQTGNDWAKPALTDPDPQPNPTGGHGPSFHTPRWFTDIDGDGLIDRLGDSGKRAFDFNVAYVEFTRRYAKGEPIGLASGKGPAQVPFTPDLGTAASLAPSAEGRKDTRFYYVDVNGDGLVDLVTQNPNDGGGIPRVRPGDGRGHFLCVPSLQPWPCQEWPTEPSPAYEIAATGAKTPWPFSDETFFHDVTGDGLADIVQYDMPSGEVRVWVNQDGRNFACASASCVAGKVLDTRTSTFNIGEHRTTFADMNADGIDDVVIIAKQGIYVGLFMTKYAPVGSFERGSAPRPGLLVRIRNGYGATTDVRYRTVQSLDLEVEGTDSAWRFHSPAAATVVTQVVTQDDYHALDNLSAKPIGPPYQFKRKTQFFYQDPAYDRWTMGFAGFRKVVTRQGDEVAETASTYWFGPCQNNGLEARVNTSPDVPLCLEGSDDEDFKAQTGRLVRVDRGNLGLFPKGLEWGRRVSDGPPSHLLWTKTYSYAPVTLFTRDDRRVSFAYPGQIDTYLYDDALPVRAGGNRALIEGGDILEDAPRQPGVRKHLRRKLEYDAQGSLKRVTEEGVIADAGESPPGDTPDAVTVTLYSAKTGDPNGPSGPDDPAALPCTSDWRCDPDYVSVWQPQPTQSGSDPAKLLRKFRYGYSPAGDVESVEGWLEAAALPLDRHHEAGGALSPPPAGQPLARGWHTFAVSSHDIWGNATRSLGGQSPGGSPRRCADVAYDKVYQQFPDTVRAYKDGCGSSALESQTVFDRGFGRVMRSTAPNGASSEVRFDPFGRPSQLYTPNPDAASGAPQTMLALSIAYGDLNPLSYVDVRRVVGPGATVRSVSVLNALGELAMAFDQGDNNDWLVNGWRETNSSGRVDTVRRPWTFAGDPVAVATNATAVGIPADNGSFLTLYDDFGREASVREQGVGFSLELTRNRYRPLSLETRDAEQLKAGGLHEKAFQRASFDGRGRTISTLQHIENPKSNDILTTTEYAPTGEPTRITRTHAGATYERTLKFDSLGRLVFNAEPNTGKNWRYAWDDAGRLVGTSDARGCGENLYYDGLGRTLGEDYSPCLASQPAYTAPNLETGAGLETFYRYDAYEDGQLSLEPTFRDAPELAVGNLVSVRDRGSLTRFNYDIRGRTRRVARQLAKPDITDPLPYAPRWFSSRFDFDLGDRPTRQTTGADLAELLIGGSSEARYAYTPGGLLSGIDSSYGPLIKSQTYDPEGAPTSIVYGDARGTTARFGYDARHQLSLYQLIAPAQGAALPIGGFDYRIPSRDLVGNPLEIDDFRIDWQLLPPEARPVEKRVMAYDDLYRLTQVDNAYKTADGTAPWRSPFAAELAASDRHPVPMRALPSRIARQTFGFDGLGNMTASGDDLSARYDRSLGGNLSYGPPQDGPNQLRSGQGLAVRYDATGNVIEVRVERPGSCPDGTSNRCAQIFAYDWDEVGQLARSRRWDFDGNVLPADVAPGTLPARKPDWDLSYAYSMGMRVRKSVTDPSGATAHTLEVFDTLRIERARFNPVDGTYGVKPENEQVYPGGIGHAFYDADGSLPHQAPNARVTMHLVIGDLLGSSSVVINHATSELVERTTYQPFGAVENDHRVAKWKDFREPYKFTGKEEDAEVGATYFGARYYQPYLGRFLSADPLTIQGLGSDLNPYAYVGGQVTRAVDPFGLRMDEVPCTGGEAACYEIVDEPAKAQDAESQAARGEAAASSRPPPTFVREHPQPTQSWVETPENQLGDDEIKQAESSAGGFVFPRAVRTTNSEAYAKQYPTLAPRIRAAEREKTFIKLSPMIVGLLVGVIAPTGEVITADSAYNVANGSRLNIQLVRDEAESTFTSDGLLHPESVSGASKIIDGVELNPWLRNELTRDGSNIADWGKYSTATSRSPTGPFQVHFYYNPAKGEVNYAFDYKVVLNQTLGR